MQIRFVVLSSSRGTTFEAVLKAIKDQKLFAPCLGLVTDKADRGCAEKAKAYGIPVTVVERKKDEDRQSYDMRLDLAIRAFTGDKTHDVVLAALGWMFIFSGWFVAGWKNRIINVHPSLLPKYPGGHALEDALAAGEKETGMTIHLIDDGVDTGPILLQKSCPIKPGDTLDTLKPRVQELEKQWYPHVLALIDAGKLQLPAD